jgi:hypothetical protein
MSPSAIRALPATTIVVCVPGARRESGEPRALTAAQQLVGNSTCQGAAIRNDISSSGPCACPIHHIRKVH